MRSPRRDENGLKKGAWTPDEDQKLIEYIKRYRIWNWTLMAKFAGLQRSGKSCRLRWVNYLNPELKQGNITKEEEDTIVQTYLELGKRWSAIAARLPGRTDNQIKNYWHTHLKRQLEETTFPRIEAKLGIETQTFDATNVLNSNEAEVAASNLQGSLDNHPKTSLDPDTFFVGESSSSSTTSSVGVNNSNIVYDIEDASAHDLSKLNSDLRSFWTQPFSYENENLLSVNAKEAYDHDEDAYGFYLYLVPLVT